MSPSVDEPLRVRTHGLDLLLIVSILYSAFWLQEGLVILVCIPISGKFNIRGYPFVMY